MASFADAQDQSEPQATVMDMRETTCAELLALPPEDRGYVLVLLFGYHAGSTQSAVQTHESIDRNMKACMRACAEDPQKSVLEVLSEAY